MRITVNGGIRSAGKSDLIAVPCYLGKKGAEIDPVWAPHCKKEVAALLGTGDFTGKAETQKVIYAPATPLGAERILLVGLGEASALTPESFRRYGGIVTSLARKTAGKRAVALLPTAGEFPTRAARARAVAEGLGLGAYSFDLYKKTDAAKRSQQNISAILLLLPDEKELAEARRAAAAGLNVAFGVNLCREVGNLPANDLGPVELAERAKREGRAAGLAVRILDERALRREGMGALLGVASGSARPPRLIALEYAPRSGRRAKGAPLVFVGKAVTFDSGGISIKPADGMQDMKFDLCGGAAVLGAMAAIARLKPKRRVVGIISSAENMPSGTALRPGDILRSAAGLTVEVINTDAEGRLVLADALHYAKRYKPELVVDLATLTGACVVALGAMNGGLFAKDAALADRVRKAAAEAGEPFWPMPVDDAYFELIKSEVADIKNSGGRYGGAVTAALFLSKFIDGFPWVHLDIAGTAWTDKESAYTTRGATGCGVRTLVRLAETWA